MGRRKNSTKNGNGELKENKLSTKTKPVKPKRATIRTSLPVIARSPGMPIPNPTQLERELTIDMVDAHRRDDCIEYDRCLDKACAKGWRSFTCIYCSAYIPTNGVNISTPLFPPEDLFLVPEDFDNALPPVYNLSGIKKKQ